jgi:branched-chain amino acid transport system substrate-binding protein
MGTSRREFLKSVGAVAVGSGVLGAPAVLRAQTRRGIPSDPVKIGVLPIRAGVAAPVGAAGQRGVEWWTERVNKAGGILGRKVDLIFEEESSPKDTVERFRKLSLQTRVDVITGGISTAVGLALGPVAEELGMLWLSWDATTQKGVEETMPRPKYSFRSVDNEVEAVGGAILTAKYFKGIRTIAGINNDYSYGRDCWDAYQAVLKRYVPDVKPVLDLWPKLGVTDFTSHIAAIQQAKPDLLMTSFWSGDTTILLKQAAAVGLLKTMKGCFTTGGGVHDSLKKSFTPEGLILGYNSMYFNYAGASPLLKQFVREYKAKYGEYPPYECDHGYFAVEAYKAGVEKAYKAAGEWPSKEQVAKALEGIEVESLSGPRSYREDHVMMCNFYQGITTHKNEFDFVTIDPVEVLPTSKIMKPSAGAKLYDWINATFPLKP